MRVFRPILNAVPYLSPSAEPCFVCVAFSGLLTVQDMTLPLFDQHERKRRLAQVVVGEPKLIPV